MIKNIIEKIRIGLEIIKKVKNWEHVFLSYFRINNKNTIFKFRDGRIIKIRKASDKNDTSGIDTVYGIFFRKDYCKKDLTIKKNDIVIDIGANIGVFSIYSSLKAPKGKVYAYEPFKVHYKRLLDNIKLNNLENVFAFNLAVCEKKGKRDFFIHENCSGMHSLIFKEDSKEKVTVDCTTLEEIFKKEKIKKCDFLKIDCEGAEYEILYNTPKNILNKIKKIALEFDNIDDYEKNCLFLKEFLEKEGFIVKIDGSNQKQGLLYAKK